MNPQNNDYIAVDIGSKNHRVQSALCGFDIANSEAGFQELMLHIQTLDRPVVVLEASGGYERKLMKFLSRRNIPVALVNPAWVRAFAASDGIKAKTDPIDAKVLLRFAIERNPRITPPVKKHQAKLIELLDRRQHLCEFLARDKNRLEKQPNYIGGYILKMMKTFEKEIDRLDAKIITILEKDSLMKRQAEVMQSVIGIGPITAWTILAYVGEVTELNRNQLVSLAGLAPFNRESDQTKKPRHIVGGRQKVRRCLYMATKSAAQHNPVIKDYVERLRARGKPYNCAIVAGMRKMLIHIQSLLKKDKFMLAG